MNRPLRTTRVGRTARPAAVAARAGLRWALTYTAWGDRRKTRRQRAMLRTAEDVTKALGEMKGAAMKVGQVLSMMTGAVPDEMAGQLATLQSGAPPMAFNLVEDVFRAEFGERPGKRFRHFEKVPFAAASIGQVHRAELPDGRQVAVKVQYPGVAAAIDHDLANVGVLLNMGGLIAKGMDMPVVIDDLKEGIRGELDYRREAAYQARFADLYRGHPFIRVPEVYPELSSGRVLVQEYVHGKPFREAVHLDQAERDRIGEAVFRFAFGNFYVHGLFNGDPHPGNYLLAEDGRVAFVDYGCIAEFDRDTIGRFCDVIRAIYAGDDEAWRAATERVGILRPGAPFPTDDLWEHMKWFWAPVLEEEITFTRELASEMVRHNSQTTGYGGEINRHLNIPHGMVFLSRINFGLAGVLGALAIRGPWRSIIGEYVFGWAPRTSLGEADAAFRAEAPHHESKW